MIACSIENITIEYKNRKKSAKKLTVSTTINMPIQNAWHFIKQSRLLEFVCKGMVTFKPVQNAFPAIWVTGTNVATKTLLYGILPFGGTRVLYFKRVDDAQHIIATEEHDATTRIWNHTMTLKPINEKTTAYTDEIIIYAGILTTFVTYWAKGLYKHRQKRWQFVNTNVDLR
jgi:hypothetical protein